jgi:hypothetical protein
MIKETNIMVFNVKKLEDALPIVSELCRSDKDG